MKKYFINNKIAQLKFKPLRLKLGLDCVQFGVLPKPVINAKKIVWFLTKNTVIIYWDGIQFFGGGSGCPHYFGCGSSFSV